jgi:deazaflavin-dependent oxidoreductase (nitroreductase family)
MTSVNDFNKTIIEEFRANGGKVGGQFANATLLLLTTIGAKSGQARVNPAAYTTDGDRLIIIASKGGAPTNPDWYYNLKANPIVTVELGREQFQASAVVAEGSERDRLFTQMAEVMPGFADYQRNTDRQIPVIVLERMG